MRIRRGDEYVVELGRGTELRFDSGDEGTRASRSGRRTLIASAGSVRIATGPTFDPAVPLVVETPHVRASVVGTIFGVDVEDDHTCVCCLEGEVRVTRADSGDAGSSDEFVSIETGHAGLAMEDDDGIERLALIESHLQPLRALQGAF